MNTKIFKKSYFTIFFLLAIFVFFFLISRWAPVAGDDWVYAIGGRYSSNPFLKAYEFYLGWSGRYLSELWGFLIADHKSLWNIINACLFTGIAYFIYKTNHSRYIILTFVLIFMLMVTVSEGLRVQTYTWIMGTTYIIPLFLFLIQIYLLYGYVFEDKNDNRRILLLCILNLMIPLYMENAAGMMVGANIVVLIYLFIKDKAKLKKITLITCVSLIGLGLIYFSPGAQLRMFRDHAYFHNLPLFTKIGMNWKTYISYTFRDHEWLVRLISLFSIIVVYQNRENHKNWMNIGLYVIFCLGFIHSFVWNLYDLTKLNLFYILADLNVPHSILLNTCFYALWLISLCVLLLGYSSNNKGIYGIYLLLCALGANAVMLISPIFDVRSSVYTIYLFISLTILLLNECTFNNVSQSIMIGLCSILCFMHVLDYIRLYHTIHLVNNKREAQIEYYINHPEEKDMWFIAFPRERVHSGNIEEGDETHFYYFKEYYGLNQDNQVHFYYLDTYTKEEIEKS